MSTSDMKQAREWSDRIRNASDNGYPIDADCYSAAEVIQSLPDQWIDADKLRQIIDFQGTSISEEARKDIESLLTPPLPTLYELMVKQKKNPEEYRWMQAKAFHTGEQGCVTDFDLYREIATVIFPNGVMKNVPWEEVTPLPDLPRLEWPGTEPAETESAVDDLAHAIRLTVEYTGNDLLPAIPGWSWFDALMKHRPDLAQPFIDKPITSPEPADLPRPEDVPAGEPWIVRYDGEEWAGVRADEDRGTWSISSMDGLGYRDVDDSEITLVSRLVPEDKP